ncbi:SusC/RagA family TonB-linked outer membrane protein [Sphingobacterium sp. GVS05A]|uniref:SusC/RagA family TonB-linked outer membrane protein n=1 Tax=Sphingobacterium sp. GVS05A TaxID=2862679 RepID=UPI001CC1273B|nr:TonB-dependent receptor [Sphingobacterium sp. GVS05A]
MYLFKPVGPAAYSARELIKRTAIPLAASFFLSTSYLPVHAFHQPAVQQQSTITGTVRDVRAAPLVGVTVHLKRTNQTVKTDEQGRFNINASANDVLLITSVGYKEQQVLVGGSKNYNITLEEDTRMVDEVVVVGYATQKKVNLSGSVASVSGKRMTERPVPNVQNLLQGRIAGLDVVQPTGEPGRDNGSMRIRGLGSSGASPNPLVLVDGVIGSISNLSPQDIENVTVLKDAASASIYGARAANGVILVTTKKGKAGTSNIEYNGYWGTSEATKYPDLITNSVTYMEMYNAARARSGQPAIYTQEQIDSYKNNPNSEAYPNFDWLDYILGKGPVQNHNLSFSGGSEKSTHNLSFNYLDQNSITKGYLYKRYNGLADYGTQVHKRVKIGTNVNFSYEDFKAPWMTNDDLLLLAYASAPTFKPWLPDGSGRSAGRDYMNTGGTNRTAEEVFNTGRQLTKKYNVNAQAYMDVDIMDGLKWSTKAAFAFFNEDYRNRQFGSPSFAYHPNDKGEYEQSGNGSPDFVGLRQSSGRSLTKTFYSTLNYVKTLASVHNISILGGYEQQDNRTTSIGGGRYDFPNNTIMELDGSSAREQSLNGSSFEWSLKSLFGRINYDYKGKYFAEGNIRYDGTSRVGSKYRWGTFGGGSAAWRISEEDFIKDNVGWLDNLKLRASYGALGNQEIRRGGNLDYYPYQEVLDNVTYPFSTLESGAIKTRLVEKNLRWEKTAITDFGLDIDIYKGLFGATIDWYSKNTTDILEERTDVPASRGLTPPIINAGAMVNKGIEIELRHQNQIGTFNYGANIVFSRYRNKVTKRLTETLGTIEIGRPYDNFFLYDWIGIFQSEAEIDNSPKQPNSGVLKPGDLKMRDVDGNGIIGPEDRIRISRFPDYTYSFNLYAGWNGFNISAFFQGVQGQKVQVSHWGYEPFMQGSAPPTKFLDAWTPTNPSNTVPAVYLTGYAGVSGYPSTYFLQDASYLRLKNLYLSYTFPESMTKRIAAKGITLYVSGDNLITWTKYEGNDPERSGSGRFAQFPQIKMYTAGIKIKY